jgi:hypothetical protein
VELQLDLSQHFATSSHTGLTSTIGKETERAENASPLGNIDLIDSSTAIAVAQSRGHRNEQTSTRSAMAVAQKRHSAAGRRPSRRPAVPLFGCF